MSDPRPERDGFDGLPDLDHGHRRELLQDQEAAKRTLEEYRAAGIEDTIPYREYRAERLGSDS